MLLFINYYFLLRERGNFIMKQFCALIGKFFGIIAIVFLVLGLTMPQNFFVGIRQGTRHQRSELHARYRNVRHGHHTEPEGLRTCS